MDVPQEISPSDEDALDEALEESFPASDPPSTWSGIVLDPVRRGAASES